MLCTNQPSDPEVKAGQLARLTQMLDLEIAAEDLAALSNQPALDRCAGTIRAA